MAILSGVVPVIKLTLSQFQSRLLKVTACSFVGLTAITDPEMKVRMNPYRGRVLKLCRVNGAICWRYSSSVNRQRQREEQPTDFRAFPRKWGGRVERTPLVVHIDEVPQLYLEVKVQQATALFFDRETHKEIPFETLKPYFPKRRPSRQKLSKDVVLKDYRLDHIAEMRIGKEVWQIEPCWWRMQILQNGSK